MVAVPPMFQHANKGDYMSFTIPTKLQLAQGTAAEWSSTNPVLASGEDGYETDTGKRKTGDGVTPWNNLPYSGYGRLIGIAANLAEETQLFSQGYLIVVRTDLNDQVPTTTTANPTPSSTIVFSNFMA